MDHDQQRNSNRSPNDRLNSNAATVNAGADGTNFSKKSSTVRNQRRTSNSQNAKREKPLQRMRSNEAKLRQDVERQDAERRDAQRKSESRSPAVIELADIVPVMRNHEITLSEYKEHNQNEMDHSREPPSRKMHLSSSPRANNMPSLKRRSSRQGNSREVSDRGQAQSNLVGAVPHRQKSNRALKLQKQKTKDIPTPRNNNEQLIVDSARSEDSNSNDQLEFAVQVLEQHCQNASNQQPAIIDPSRDHTCQNYQPQLIQTQYQMQHSIQHSIQHSSMNESLREELARSERTLQSQQHAQVSKQDRRRIMQYSIARVIVHSVITITLFLIVKRGEKDAKGCSEDVHKYLTYCAYYFGLCCLRQFIVCILLPCTKRPQRLRDLANVVFIAIDIFLFTCLTVFGTKIMFAEETEACREGADGANLLLMWIFAFCCLIWGWIYCTLLCCGCITTPFILIFWCVYRMQMNEISREESTGLRSPGNAKSVLKSLRKEKFGSMHTADTCIICLEKFKEDEFIAELPCDGRHMFHYHCLEQWLHNKVQCPLCKQALRPRYARGALGRAWDYIMRGRQNPDNNVDDLQASPAISEPINRAINDPINIAVDLGLNSEYDPPRSSQAVRQAVRSSPAREPHRDREDAPVSQQELRQIFVQLQRQQEQIEEQKQQIDILRQRSAR